MHDVHVLLYGFLRSRVQRSAAGHVKEFAAEAFDLVNVIDDGRLAVLGRLEQNRAGTVTEDDAGRAVFVVDHGRIHVGADDENLLVGAAFDQLGAGGQSENEAGATGGEIETPGLGKIQLVLDEARRGRVHHIRGDGG